MKANGFLDTFSEERPSGQVVGSHTPEGVARRGVDTEKVIGIDNGALRIRPLLNPGWGRSGIAYGPYERLNGLTMGVFLLNGHHSSQTGHLTQSLSRRLVRWARGSGVDGLQRRLWQWTLNGDKQALASEARRWAMLNRKYGDPVSAPAIDDNLGVGWFPQETTLNPLDEGHAFIVRAGGPDNGSLMARVDNSACPTVFSLQNIPLYLAIMLRERGAVYYAASLPGAAGLSGYPEFRPLAVDPFNCDPVVYAALHQSVLGQIGFRVDTRVYAFQVAELEEYDMWYGSAQTADRLIGPGALTGRTAEQGGRWRVYRGEFVPTPDGVRPEGEESLAVLRPSGPSGLIHLMIDPRPAEGGAGPVWRFRDDDNFWCLLVEDGRYRLMLKESGAWQEAATAERLPSTSDAPLSLQIADDGRTMKIAADGKLLFGGQFEDIRLGMATGVGLYATPGNYSCLRNLEAHPRVVCFPALFGPQFAPVETQRAPIVADDFGGEQGDLEGRQAQTGDGRWRRTIGAGVIAVNGRRTAKVSADVSAPNPGRTAYTIDWDDPDSADLQVTITPPGSGRGQGEKGRGGLIFWQDPANYFIVNTWLDDYYGGASISSFFHLNGFEELYDAVWTNVGRRVRWGAPYRLRVRFDGLCYTAFVDEEPVLYRSLRDVYPKFDRLSIRRVGLAVNWEWGDDTGSVFSDFIACS